MPTMPAPDHFPSDAEDASRPTPLSVPVPPQFAEACGYRGAARFVGLHWTPYGDELLFDDGRISGTGDAYAFLAFARHAAVASHLRPYHLGSSDREAEHTLVIDRHLQQAGMAAKQSARRFLRAQHPPPPELTPDEFQDLQREIDAILAHDWQEIRVDPQAIQAAMDEQRCAIARIVAFLDQQVPPSTPLPGADDA